ncbi:hypothetical protein D3C80_1465400 [compost metagenome]
MVITRAQKAFASRVATVPIPEVPPWINTVSPALRCPRWNTLTHTVKKVSGIAAASIRLKPSGTGSALLSCTLQYSA